MGGRRIFSKQHSFFRPVLVLGLGLPALALFMRLIGLGWGLPEVYEEATPLHKAWEMWGWGPETFDPNPHFFNYPSLVIYLHLLWQGLQLAVFKILGLVTSTLDFRVMFEVEKTPIFYAGRLLTALLGTGTVALVFQLGRRLAGLGAGTAAAFLLAVNTFHIGQSQLIAVDVPLTFFTTAALVAMVRLGPASRIRDHLLTGALIGLAVSAKYTAAVLVAPYLVAHLSASFQATRSRVISGSQKTWLIGRPILLGLGVVALVFAVTSPYVILDHEASLHSLATEQGHMREGHFGLDKSPGRDFYLRSLATTIVGWPMLLAAGMGIWALWVCGRKGMIAVLVVFLGVFLIPISSWSMKADRYLVPVVPVLAVLAGCGISLSGRVWSRFRWPRSGGIAAGILATLLICIPTFTSYPALLARARPDTRTTALRWIEVHIPPGSFILSEFYGPELLRPVTLLPLDQEIQDRLLTGESRRPVFAVQVLPLFQTRPERSAVYYDLGRHPDADYILISGSVRSRYAKDPDRFERQLAFYAEVENSWEGVRDFDPDSGVGPRLSLFKNPRRDQPYVQRAGSPPVVMPPSAEGLLRGEGFHYFSLGANAMGFGQPRHAEQAFRLGLGYEPLRPEIALNLVLGIVWVMEDQGQVQRATAFLDSLETAGSGQMQEIVRRIRGSGPGSGAGASTP